MQVDSLSLFCEYQNRLRKHFQGERYKRLSLTLIWYQVERYNKKIIIIFYFKFYYSALVPRVILSTGCRIYPSLRSYCNTSLDVEINLSRVLANLISRRVVVVVIWSTTCATICEGNCISNEQFPFTFVRSENNSEANQPIKAISECPSDSFDCLDQARNVNKPNGSGGTI